MGYLKPLPKRIGRGQRFGENPGLGPNPAGGHNGDDYKSWVGEPIYAAGDGVVIHAGTFDSTYADNFGWNLNFGGNMVVLNVDGDTAPYVEYGHMDKIYVDAGQRVRRGQVIGTTGATDGGTGVITGPHLHVGCLPPNFNLNTNTYGRVNPDLYLTDYPDETIGSLSYAGETITPVSATQPKEWDDMASIDDFKQAIRDVTKEPYGIVDSIAYRQINGFNGPVSLEARILGTDQAVNDIRALLAGQNAQIAGLVGALAAVSKGEPFDQEKLLAGVKDAAETGVKDAIESITVTVKADK